MTALSPSTVSSRDSAQPFVGEALPHRSTRFEHSYRILSLMQAFFPPTRDGTIPEALQKLLLPLRAGKKLQQAMESLQGPQQREIQSQVGNYLEKIYSLSQEQDPQLFWEGVLDFGLLLKKFQKLEVSSAILQTIVSTAKPFAVRNQAQAELQALQGKGPLGLRAETWFLNVEHQATDYRSIVPMIGASMLGQLTGAALLGRLAGASRATWFTRGLGAQFLSGAGGFLLAELPAYISASRALHGNTQTPLREDLAQNALSLGALRVFGFLGSQAFLKFHGINELGLPTQLAGLTKFSHLAFSQASIFTGLMFSHLLEKRWGLRPQGNGDAMLSDILGSMVSMQVGSYVGHRMLGSRLTSFQTEIGLRTDNFSKLENWKIPEIRALAPIDIVPGRLLPAMAGDSGSLPMKVMMAAEGTGGGSSLGGGGSPPRGERGTIDLSSCPELSEPAQEFFSHYEELKSTDAKTRRAKMNSFDITKLALAAPEDPMAVIALSHVQVWRNREIKEIFKKQSVETHLEKAKIDPQMYFAIRQLDGARAAAEAKLSREFEEAREEAQKRPDSASALQQAYSDFRASQEKLMEAVESQHKKLKEDPRYRRANQAASALQILDEAGNPGAKEARQKVIFWWTLLGAKVDTINGVFELHKWAKNNEGEIREQAEKELKEMDTRQLSYDARMDENPKAIKALLVLAEYENPAALPILRQVALRDEKLEAKLKSLPDRISIRKKGRFTHYREKFLKDSEE